MYDKESYTTEVAEAFRHFCSLFIVNIQKELQCLNLYEMLAPTYFL